MDTPKDPALFLTAFVAVCLPVILGTWLLMPVHHVELEEGEEVVHEPLVNVNLALSPQKLLQKVNGAIQQGAAALEQLEAEAEEKEADEKEAKEKIK